MEQLALSYLQLLHPLVRSIRIRIVMVRKGMVQKGIIIPAPVWQDEFDQLFSPVYHRLWAVCLLWLQSPDEARHHLRFLCGHRHGGSTMPLLQPLAQVSLSWSFRGNLEETDLD